jgi:hypothetical protein
MAVVVLYHHLMPPQISAVAMMVVVLYHHQILPLTFNSTETMVSASVSTIMLCGRLDSVSKNSHANRSEVFDQKLQFDLRQKAEKRRLCYSSRLLKPLFDT